MKTSFARAVLFALLLAGASVPATEPSRAATITAVVTGTVAATGQSFEADFVFDSSLGQLTCGSTDCYRLEGFPRSLTNPLLSATLSIGDAKYEFAGTLSAAFELTTSAIGLKAQDSKTAVLTFSLPTGASTPTDLNSPFTLNMNARGAGSFCAFVGVCGVLDVASISSTVWMPATTPLPATLPLFALGLLGLIVAARRCRATADASR